MTAILSSLRSNDATAGWLAELEALGAPPFAVELPAAGELPPVLLKLAVPHQDIDELIAALATIRGSAEAWWLFERCVHALDREIGQLESSAAMPQLPDAMGSLQRYFYVLVFVALLPRVQAFHRARAIPDEVSWLILADLGRNMSIHRSKYGSGGLEVPWWIRLHFRGVIYQLGRLQFERATLGKRTGRAIQAAGLPYGPGDPVLSVHIPEYFGPLSPEACDNSFASAGRFFARYFPEQPYAIAVCHSWLLDEQLAEYLPASGNIVSFGRRFRSAYRPDDDDTDILEFVFRLPNASLDELPQRTSLERAVVEHIRSGRHWHGGAGWLLL